MAHDMVWGNALDLIKLLDDHHVTILRNHPVRKITETGAESAGRQFRADSVVLAVGMEPVNGVTTEDLQGQIPEVYTIGDCVSPRHVMHAIWEGYRTARLV